MSSLFLFTDIAIISAHYHWVKRWMDSSQCSCHGRPTHRSPSELSQSALQPGLAASFQMSSHIAWGLRDQAHSSSRKLCQNNNRVALLVMTGGVKACNIIYKPHNKLFAVSGVKAAQWLQAPHQTGGWQLLCGRTRAISLCGSLQVDIRPV